MADGCETNLQQSEIRELLNHVPVLVGVEHQFTQLQCLQLAGEKQIPLHRELYLPIINVPKIQRQGVEVGGGCPGHNQHLVEEPWAYAVPLGCPFRLSRVPQMVSNQSIIESVISFSSMHHSVRWGG